MLLVKASLAYSAIPFSLSGKKNLNLSRVTVVRSVLSKKAKKVFTSFCYNTSLNWARGVNLFLISIDGPSQPFFGS